jgi:hypothetical protein
MVRPPLTQLIQRTETGLKFYIICLVIGRARLVNLLNLSEPVKFPVAVPPIHPPDRFQ